eukprot:IDg21861t1
MSCLCTGSTHDSVAFDVSDLARKLREGALPSGFWLAGDPAYAFRILIRRWGIFWRPLNYALADILPILSSAMRLHNFAIDEDGVQNAHFDRDAHDSELRDAAFAHWWSFATALSQRRNDSNGHRQDLESNELRDKLKEFLEMRGILRPF